MPTPPFPKPPSTSTSLSITNPLVLYRTLLATHRLKPDPAQHRLALHLQKLYFRLKDYRPEIDYRRRLQRVARGSAAAAGPSRHPPDAASNSTAASRPSTQHRSQPTHDDTTSTTSKPTTTQQQGGILSSLLGPRATAEMKALLPSTPLHDTAMTIDSPRGLLLYGEVGRGKSMLVDLLFNALPSDRKRRWHFSTFMLDVFRRLEGERVARLERERVGGSGGGGGGGGKGALGGVVGGGDNEHVVLSLARETVETSPILFLDEFQMPDRASSRLVNGFLTGFFGLGGVLVASSNRMPEELSRGVGVRFREAYWGVGERGRGRWGRGGWVGWLGRGGDGRGGRGGKQDETERFVEVLKARCDVWEMEGERDWRREGDEDLGLVTAGVADDVVGGEECGGERSLPITSTETETPLSASSIPTLTMSKSTETPATTPPASTQPAPASDVPPHYHLTLPSSLPALTTDITTLNPTQSWTPTTLSIFTRTLHLPTTTPSGVLLSTFADLCARPLGPADYVSLASTFHSVILTDVPVLTSTLKNEARRLIWLIDALYEAGCRLVVAAEAPVDGLFFPEVRRRRVVDEQKVLGEGGKGGGEMVVGYEGDSIESEAMSEMYQDSTAPFRANVASYGPGAEWRSADPTFAPLRAGEGSVGARRRERNVLADEDADFGPTYGNGRGHGMSSEEGYREALRRQGVDHGMSGGLGTVGVGPDFTDTRVLVGEDERFAYKRARSRLWEMCGNRWWREREGDVEGWWKREERGSRFWEKLDGEVEEVVKQVVKEVEVERQGTHDGGRRSVDAFNDAEGNGGLFRHGASPYRTSEDAPPKFGWQHAWGMMKWGKKAGEWGKGVEGDRRKTEEGRDGK